MLTDPVSERQAKSRDTEALELLKMWRRMVIENPGGVPRYKIVSGAALNQLTEWTDEFLRRY